MGIEPCSLGNGESVGRAAIPCLPFETFRTHVCEQVAGGQQLLALFGVPEARDIVVYACVGEPELGLLHLVSTRVQERYRSLTPDCPQAHWFEREIAEQWGVVPDGHPWLKPIRFHESYRKGSDAWGREPASITVGDTSFYRIEGDEVHEVAVGPVHAGVIEPGHFRFQCHGETVFLLEISLGYQHRGVERALLGGPSPRCLALAETIAGDTTVGHATAYCQVIEALAGVEVVPRALALRGVALELERLANHTGDLGALAGDVAYLPTASYCGRLRGDLLNLTALSCGSRFGRGWLRPGGVRADLEPSRAAQLLERLETTMRELTQAVELLWNTPSVMARFEGMGVVPQAAAQSLGLVGPAGRASGMERDVREQFPAGIYRFSQVPVSSWETGDVFARAFVRWLEIQHSVAFLRRQLKELPRGPAFSPAAGLRPDSVAVSLVEGWRGELCHIGFTDSLGRFAHYKIIDPSFHNWIGLAMALRNQPISEFPLCNKSFNLSYCGHDL